MIYPFCSQDTMVLLSGSLRPSLYLVKRANHLLLSICDVGHDQLILVMNKTKRYETKLR